jgi:mannose/fructose/N-acetylgalactosamine-specific phosphotransferase system component IID
MVSLPTSLGLAGNWLSGSLMCKILRYVKRITMVASSLCVTVMTYERHIAVKEIFPVRIRSARIATRLTVAVIIGNMTREDNIRIIVFNMIWLLKRNLGTCWIVIGFVCHLLCFSS